MNRHIALAIGAVVLTLLAAGCNCGAPNPLPTLATVSPDQVQPGDGGLILTLTGTNFIATSSVEWNGSTRDTTYLPDAGLTALIPATDIASGGVAQVTVRNPTPGGGVSNALEVTVTATQVFASGSDWPSFDGDLGGSDGGSLGPARLVCVTPTVPAGCPTGALAYHTTGAGWGAHSAQAPGAHWIWRGDVALTAVADLKFAVFERTFQLGAGPAGRIDVGADDFVEVRVNGTTVGTCGSVTNGNTAGLCQSTGASFDLSSFLHPGANTLTVVGQNGPASFAGCASPPCTYVSNLAGVIFGGTLSSH